MLSGFHKAWAVKPFFFFFLVPLFLFLFLLWTLKLSLKVMFLLFSSSIMDLPELNQKFLFFILMNGRGNVSVPLKDVTYSFKRATCLKYFSSSCNVPECSWRQSSKHSGSVYVIWMPFSIGESAVLDFLCMTKFFHYHQY